MMFAFYSDGGAHQDHWRYYINKVFGDGSHLYSTKSIPDPLKYSVIIQGYAGRAAQLPSGFRSANKYNVDSYHIKIPIEEYLLDNSSM